MAGLSNYLAYALFGATISPTKVALTPPTEVYLALHTAAPDDTVRGNEASYGGYVRKQINNLSAADSDMGGGDIDLLVVFGMLTGHVPS